MNTLQKNETGTWNLLREYWIPIRRKSGARERIAPWQITDRYQDDPIVALDDIRPDFNAALAQFLIGLLQTLCPPDELRNWKRWLKEPPSPEVLREAFEKVACAFFLDGDGPRFMQDLEKDLGKGSSIYAMLTESPGEDDPTKNAAFFYPWRKGFALSYGSAATALFALQTNAGSGGAGHRTSLRGGGPLTFVLVQPDLWLTLWSNVLCRSDMSMESWNSSDWSLCFPWLAPTLTSKQGESIRSEQMHPAHVFWGMPRRVRLNCDGEKGACFFTGGEGPIVRSFEMKPHGMNYGDNWEHPLTAYTRDEKQEIWLTQKGRPNAVSYQHWCAWMAEDKEGKRRKPWVLRLAQSSRRIVFSSLGLKQQAWIFGYDFDNAKVRGWCEARMPLFLVSEEQSKVLEEEAARLVRIAEEMLDQLIQSIQKALFKRPTLSSTRKILWEAHAESSPSSTFFSSIRSDFWQQTEASFYECLEQFYLLLIQNTEADPSLSPPHEALARTHSPTVEALRLGWWKELQHWALRSFEQSCQLEQIQHTEAEALIVARQELLKFTSQRAFAKILDVSVTSAA